MAKKASSATDKVPSNPWRETFEALKAALTEKGNKRDKNGTVGSINWLRKAMETRGANPNVVRNILYRDKGKLEDKRILFQLLDELWQSTGRSKLQVPELEVMLSTSSSNEQEVMQLLGREKRRAYRYFVGGVRSEHHPKMLVMGRPGSGKTLLTDYIQEALERPPAVEASVIRLGFSRSDMDASLGRLAEMVGVARERFESRLLRIGASSAFAVQADAQAEVARIIVDEVRYAKKPFIFLLHISQVIGSEGEDTLAGAPLRLFQDDVPRVTSTEWLWENLIFPLTKLPTISVFVSMVDIFPRVQQKLQNFHEPIKLSPPTSAEARNFVRSRLPQLSSEEQDALVERAKRSFEDLRTLTLLAEIRDALGVAPPDEVDAASERYIQQLSHLVGSVGHESLKRFLGALGLLSLQEYPSFHVSAMLHLQYGVNGESVQELRPLEQAFLDAVPARAGMWRSFSRRLARALRKELRQGDPSLYQELSRVASEYYHASALAEPQGEAGYRYVYYLLAAESWQTLADWLKQYSAPQALMQRLWQQIQAQDNKDNAATQAHKQANKSTERQEDDALPLLLFLLSYRIAAYYVRMGSYHHLEVKEALDKLAQAPLLSLRMWTQLKHAEGHINRGQYSQAEAMLATIPPDIHLTQATPDRPHNSKYKAASAAPRYRKQKNSDEPDLSQRLQESLAQELHPALLHLELTLAQAAIARWRSQLSRAASLINEVARADLATLIAEDSLAPQQLRWLQSQLHMWAGLIAKDTGALPEALEQFSLSEAQLAPSSSRQWRNDYQVARARLSFQQGDVSMMLGHFGYAERALQQALHLSESSEAPQHERLRYMTRYANLLRLTLQFSEAEQHIRQAYQLLEQSELGQVERAFEYAKLCYDDAQLKLAQGEHSQAILLLHTHIENLNSYQEIRQVDTSFRRLRAKLALARAYWGRAHQQAWSFPFLAILTPESLARAESCQHPDHQHAVQIMKNLLEVMSQEKQRYEALYIPTLLTASLILADKEQARAQLQAALQQVQLEYMQAISHAHLAFLAWRSHDIKTSAQAIKQAQYYLAKLQQQAKPNQATSHSDQQHTHSDQQHTHSDQQHTHSDQQHTHSDQQYTIEETNTAANTIDDNSLHKVSRKDGKEKTNNTIAKGTINKDTSEQAAGTSYANYIHSDIALALWLAMLELQLAMKQEDAGKGRVILSAILSMPSPTALASSVMQKYQAQSLRLFADWVEVSPKKREANALCQMLATTDKVTPKIAHLRLADRLLLEQWQPLP